VIEVEQPAHLAGIAAEACSEGDLAQTLAAHSLVDGELGGHRRRQHGAGLAALGTRRLRNRLALSHEVSKERDQGVSRLLDRLGCVVAHRQRARNVGGLGDDRPILVGPQRERVAHDRLLQDTLRVEAELLAEIADEVGTDVPRAMHRHCGLSTAISQDKMTALLGQMCPFLIAPLREQAG
jgi:hypothetical protein